MDHLCWVHVHVKWFCLDVVFLRHSPAAQKRRMILGFPMPCLIQTDVMLIYDCPLFHIFGFAEMLPHKFLPNLSEIIPTSYDETEHVDRHVHQPLLVQKVYHSLILSPLFYICSENSSLYIYTVFLFLLQSKNCYGTVQVNENIIYRKGDFMTKPLVLCIMDGVGINAEHEHNAVALANMPFFNGLLKKYPHSVLDASGPAVGLPPHTMGNSEVGHITMGAGRVVNQFLRRFELENWDNNPALRDFIDAVKSDGGIVHFAGLMSDGRVHSDINDEILIMRRVLDAGLKLCIHFIADGRDTLPQSAPEYIKLIQEKLADYLKSAQAFWGTLSGRYYTMDRNQNLDRTALAFDAIACAKSEFTAPTIDVALADAYARGETDEFIKPTVIDGDVVVHECDGFLFGNYRSDRARQIVRAMLETKCHMLCFSQYGEGLNEHCPALLPDIVVNNTLGDVLEQNGISQLRIAETEKYNHVTYFFDAERNIDFKGSEKALIASPDVATFDMKPEMSAVDITDKLLPLLNKFDVVILNYANGDMVGHTGNEGATIRAMETLDAQLSRLVPAVLDLNGTVLITADHGNAEKLWDAENNLPWTAHTTNPVNFIVVSNNPPQGVQNGGLADIAPTMLKLLNVPQPSDMTGHSLI